MKIYFAGSIRGGRDDAKLYRDIIEYLQQFGEVLTEHVGSENVYASGESGMSEEEIYQRDVEWLDQSDVVIAEVSTPSLGVGYELGYAEAKGKNVLCLYRSDAASSLSAMVAGNKYFETKEYSSLEDATNIFNDFFSK